MTDCSSKVQSVVTKVHVAKVHTVQIEIDVRFIISRGCMRKLRENYLVCTSEVPTLL